MLSFQAEVCSSVSQLINLCIFIPFAVCVCRPYSPPCPNPTGRGRVCVGIVAPNQEFRVHELLLWVFTFPVGSSPESSVCLYNLIKLSHLTMSNCGLIQLHNLQETANCAVTFVFVLLVYYRTTQTNKEEEPTQGCSTCSPFSSAILCWLSNYRECL